MKQFLIVLLCLLGVSLFSQNVTVNGYVYESGNRGYLNQVRVTIVEQSTGQQVAAVDTDLEGYFEVMLPSNKDYRASAQKQLFKPLEVDFTTKDVEQGKKKFVKIQLEREPGYDFEVTLAPKRDNEDIPVDAIRGAWIEVYNNTTEKEVLNLKNHPELEFNVHFDKGNHYTIMVRKDGFFTKRMEAFVNVEGCILCFEGVGNVRPGVVDNLTEGNDMGVLLANVELEPLFSGKTFEVENIYYDFAKSTLRPEAKIALNNLASVLKDNSHISVELGSHTDARGDRNDNQKLSEARAKSAVDYLVNQRDIPRNSIIAAGYGESQLVNDCSDGVTCTEEQHQKNRRTELKVLNIINKNKVERTLAEIRVEEEFLRSVLEGDVETKVEKAVDSTPPSLVKSPDADNMKKVDEMTTEQESEMISEVVNETQVKLVQESSSKSQESKTDNGGTVSADVISKKQMPQVENESSSGTVAGQRKRYNEYRKSKNNTDLLNDYTGFKVVIQFSKDPISTDHAIYKRHDDLIEYRASSGSILYMIGDFETADEADQFIVKTASMMYPGAYTVQFENGRRLK